MELFIFITKEYFSDNFPQIIYRHLASFWVLMSRLDFPSCTATLLSKATSYLLDILKVCFTPQLYSSPSICTAPIKIYTLISSSSWKAPRPSHAISAFSYRRIRSSLKCGFNLWGINVTSPGSWLDCLLHSKHPGVYLCLFYSKQCDDFWQNKTWPIIFHTAMDACRLSVLSMLDSLVHCEIKTNSEVQFYFRIGWLLLKGGLNYSGKRPKRVAKLLKNK